MANTQDSDSKADEKKPGQGRRKPFLLGTRLGIVAAPARPSRPFGGGPSKEPDAGDAGSDSDVTVTEVHIEPFELVPHRRGAFEFPRISIRRGK